MADSKVTGTSSHQISKSHETQKTILIVEDDPVFQKMYSEKFSFEGFNVLSAKDGEEALSVSLTQDPDIILLDIMLPKMSGTDFLEKYRQNPKGKNTPVVALSNLTEEKEKQKQEEEER